jgi:CHASE2 domain-containing sensor protein
MTDQELISSFKDSTVLVGTQLEVDTLMKANDSFDTPISSIPMCGVEIHATALSNILTQQWIRRFPKEFEEVATAALAFLLPLFILLLKPLRATVLALTSILAWAVVSYWLFLHGYSLPGRVVALVVVPTALFISVTYSYVVLRASVHEMSDALGVDISK